MHLKHSQGGIQEKHCNAKEPPYCQSCHSRYSHEKYMCDNCGKYDSTLSNINDRKKQETMS